MKCAIQDNHGVTSTIVVVFAFFHFLKTFLFDRLNFQCEPVRERS